MLRTVLKPFPLANDGLRVVDQVEGDTVEVRDDLVEGLTLAGYIAAPSSAAAAVKPVGAPAKAKGKPAVAEPAAPAVPAPADAAGPTEAPAATDVAPGPAVA